MVNKIREIYEYRQMLESLVLTDLRTRYKGSFVGFFWTFLNPLLMLFVYSIVFKYVVRIEMENYTSYLFIGLISWFLINQAVQSGAGVVIRNSGLVKKIYFPKEILPLSVVLGGVINFLFSLLILFPILFINKIQLGMPLLLFPVILVIYFMFTFSITLIVSSLNVYFRDLEHIVSIVMMVWFYLTPIVFTSSMIPKDIKYIFDYNPMKVIIESFHNIFFYNKFPDPGQLTLVAILSSVMLYIGFYIFKRLSRNFAEEI
ncbi:ABC transporter permease [Paenibacillus allorhizosphaerae]|uniref:Transport permease protein n=1 Tax=Paenibacillus allorhizosphaerae TaxID=2849866 RepID=A0ABM8VV91_9BACL|nr:ABC transporter permease [Paenibacillus allorhizosphaerae]CAG7659140.1 Teichoic acid translocation permease protein TagG [Paenibacillus allorhizosphaerae]